MPGNKKGKTHLFDVCGKCKIVCCQDAKPPLSRNRKEIIQKHLEKQKIYLKDPFTKEAYSYPSIDEDVYCRLFSKKTGKCQVHMVKPETCVAGPITFDINFYTKRIEWFLKKPEICGYASVLCNDNSAFKEHFEVAKKNITQLIKELEADELRAIVKIDEPQTFKVDEDDLPAEAVRKLGL